MKKLTNFFTGLSFSILRWVACSLPEKTAINFGKRVGRLIYKLSKKYRLRTLANLRMCYPEWEEKKIHETALKVFEHFGKNAVRFLRTANLSKQQILDSVEIFDESVFIEQLKKNKGLIVITAHLGNWERMAHCGALKGYKISVVARDIDAERAHMLVNNTREGEGIKVLSKGSAVKEIIKALQRNEIIALLADQNSWDVYVPFFGFPTGTVAGPAVLHLRTGAPIVFAFNVEKENGKYQCFFEKLELNHLSDNREENIKLIMTEANKVIEKYVRKYPEQWLWMHDRWRSARQQGLIDV